VQSSTIKPKKRALGTEAALQGSRDGPQSPPGRRSKVGEHWRAGAVRGCRVGAAVAHPPTSVLLVGFALLASIGSPGACHPTLLLLGAVQTPKLLRERLFGAGFCSGLEYCTKLTSEGNYYLPHENACGLGCFRLVLLSCFNFILVRHRFDLRQLRFTVIICQGFSGTYECFSRRGQAIPRWDRLHKFQPFVQS